MSIERYRNNDPRTASEVADAIEDTLQSLAPDGETFPVTEGTQHYAVIQSLATTIADQQEQALADVYDAGFLTEATGVELTKKAREIGVERQPATASTGVVEFQRDSTAAQDYTIPSGTVVGTGGDDTVRFVTTETTTITNGTSSAQANIECTESGAVGNVGAGAITVLVSGAVSGVDSVTNPQPTGDRSYTLTDGQTLQTAGTPRESDAALRDRAIESTAVGGAGTAGAIELALFNIPEVNSADVFTNRSGTATDNVDPWHTEVRVFGGDTGQIADRLYDVLPLITLKTLQGGANGTRDAVTIEPSPLYGSLEIPITRPTVTSLTLNIDVVHNSTYAGDDEAKDAVVRYIGGTLTNGDDVTGLVQDENVRVNTIEGAIEDVQGVVYADVTLLDANNDGTDDTTTTAEGVPIYEVGRSEVATVDNTDITLSTQTT